MTDLTPRGGRGRERAPVPDGPGGPGPLAPRRRSAPRSDAAPDSPDTIELREVLAILRRRIWLVLLFVLLGAGAGYGASLLQEPQYRANAVIRIDDPRSQMIERMGGAASGGRSQSDPVLSAIEVLRSQSVLGQIVDEEGLRLASRTPGFGLADLQGLQVLNQAPPDTLVLRFTENGVTARDRATGGPVSAGYGEELVLASARMVVPLRPAVDEARLELRERQRAIRSLSANLTARVREHTNVVDVEFVSPDPEMGRRIVNRAVEVFQERSSEDARRESMRRRVFLEEHLAQADSALEQTQRALSDFRSREQVFSSREWFAAQQAGLLEIEMRREELRADREMYTRILDGLQEAEVGDISHRLEAVVASPEVAQNPVVASLFGQLIQYETARDSLVGGPWGASPDSPDALWTEQQIAGTRDRLERAVRSHMDALEARIQALTELRARTADQVAALPETEAEESRLVQQVESMRRTVEELTSEYHRAQMAEAVEEGPVAILDRAPLPIDSERAGLPVMIALGLVLGVMLGSGGAFLLEMLNNRIRNQADVEASIQVQTLGVIPRLPAGPRNWVGRRRRPGKGAGARAALPSATGENGSGRDGTPPGGELVTVLDKRSGPAEAFRTLRTNLLFARGGDDVRALVVTSALPLEGKTTTAANLAVSYAQQGLRVLAVDCDLRKPRLAAMFGFERSPGMSELVLDEAEVADVVHEFGGVENLYVLGSGALPDNPTELLGGARMRRTLDALLEGFEVLVLDTPPLSAGADAAILGASADGVLMVVRAGETQRDAARLAAHQLDTVGANLVGAVLNDPTGEVPRYGYYYAYDYYGEEAT